MGLNVLPLAIPQFTVYLRRHHDVLPHAVSPVRAKSQWASDH